MALSFTLTPAHAAVGVSLLASVIVGQYMGGKVIAARKKYEIPLPYLYADASHGENGRKFNCVQRGHMNTVERHADFIIVQLLSGVQHPLISGGLGLLYLAGRLAYFNGYAEGDPSKRAQGNYGYLGLLGMLVLSIKFLVHLAMS